jgi:hypothetical protein
LTYAPYTYRSFTAIFADKVVCSGAVGDVKYSSLPPAQFAQVNGACWVPMDGRNITGSLLATGLGVNNVPDASGVFFRAHEYPNSINNYDPGRTPTSTIATVQMDDMKPHGHSGETSEDGAHGHSVENAWPLQTPTGADGSNVGTDNNHRPTSFMINNFNLQSVSISQSQVNSDHTVTLSTDGGVETRPKNVNFYAYIRIN